MSLLSSFSMLVEAGVATVTLDAASVSQMISGVAERDEITTNMRYVPLDD
jgi:hypothetical protein